MPDLEQARQAHVIELVRSHVSPTAACDAALAR